MHFKQILLWMGWKETWADNSDWWRSFCVH